MIHVRCAVGKVSYFAGYLCLVCRSVVLVLRRYVCLLSLALLRCVDYASFVRMRDFLSHSITINSCSPLSTANNTADREREREHRQQKQTAVLC